MLSRPRISFIASMVAAAAISCLAVTTAPAATGDCGIIATNGSTPLATDCLGILQHAVAKTLCAPFDPCVCNVDGVSDIFASDALLCLNVAVRNPAFALNCPCNPGCWDTEAPACGGECPDGGVCAPDPFEPSFCECLSGCLAGSAPTCGFKSGFTEESI